MGKSIRRIQTCTVCLRHSAAQFKGAHHLHWSKDKLSKIHIELDPKYDCRGAPATLMDMLWLSL